MPQPHEDDIIIVQNIDVECDAIDPSEGWKHSEFFQVKWDGHPHRIKPGETRKMPRYIAEHFAKHLADHMLMKMEEELGKQGMMNHPVERPKMLARIILGIDSSFHEEEPLTEGEKAVQEVDELNREDRALDLGEVVNPALGVLKEQVTPIKDVIKATTGKDKVDVAKTKDSSIWDDKKAKPTRGELFAECNKLGIDVSGKETVDQLISKIKSF
jgi:hypothetical protein